MSDIVKQLKIATAIPICKPAADEIESLRQQLAEKDTEIESFKASYESTYEQNIRLANQLRESESERMEQARLLGMSGEREAALLAEIERLKSEHATAYKLVDYWQRKASATGTRPSYRHEEAGRGNAL